MDTTQKTNQETSAAAAIAIADDIRPPTVSVEGDAVLKLAEILEAMEAQSGGLGSSEIAPAQTSDAAMRANSDDDSLNTNEEPQPHEIEAAISDFIKTFAQPANTGLFGVSWGPDLGPDNGHSLNFENYFEPTSAALYSAPQERLLEGDNLGVDHGFRHGNSYSSVSHLLLVNTEPPAAPAPVSPPPNLILYGSGGNDTINGGAGNDQIYSNEGDDQIFGLGGNDLIMSGDGNNEIDGGAGDDQIYVGEGFNTIDGGAGDDEIVTGNGWNVIDGGDGNDYIYAGEGSDYIEGGAGDDYIFSGGNTSMGDGGTGGTGGTGTGELGDIIFGGDGNDSIVVLNSFNRVSGGNGDDVFIFTSSGVDNQISDFVNGADSLDISAILDMGGVFNPSIHALNGFIRILDVGWTTYVQVDANGGGNSFANVVQLSSFSGFSAGVTATEQELQNLVSNGTLIV